MEYKFGDKEERRQKVPGEKEQVEMPAAVESPTESGRGDKQRSCFVETAAPVENEDS